jgi:predicted nuclease of predicted toxin-antitoxin system
MPGSPDVLVAKTAEANDAILIALDGDMKTLAKRAGISGGRFKRLSLLKLRRRESGPSAIR